MTAFFASGLLDAPLEPQQSRDPYSLLRRYTRLAAKNRPIKTRSKPAKTPERHSPAAGGAGARLRQAAELAAARLRHTAR